MESSEKISQIDKEEKRKNKDKKIKAKERNREMGRATQTSLVL
jgi:hypothetical protein